MPTLEGNDVTYRGTWICVLGLVNVCISHSQNHPRDDWALGNARNSKQGLHHDSGAQGLEELSLWGLEPAVCPGTVSTS